MKLGQVRNRQQAAVFHSQVRPQGVEDLQKRCQWRRPTLKKLISAKRAHWTLEETNSTLPFDS